MTFTRVIRQGLLVALVSIFVPSQGFSQEFVFNSHVSQIQAELQQKIAYFEQSHYHPCRLESSPSEYRPIDFLILDQSINSKEVREFLTALVDEKKNLMDLYSIDNQLYNELAMKAIGILGNESRFFTHYLYQYKANMPDPVVYATKHLINLLQGENDTSSLSKGPTAMKSIPVKIGEAYNITDKEQLEVPFNAAVATIGYLAETYQELIDKTRAYDLKCVTDENFADMHLYLYFGGASYRRDLLNCNVQPHLNIYIRNVWQNSKKVQIFEFSPQSILEE